MAERKAVWLLDPRFDFLIPGFLKHFQIEENNLTLVGSYHGPTRAGWKTGTVGDSQLGHVVFLEPEDLNRRYAPQLEQDAPDVVAAFTGAYLPESPSFETVLATGKIAVDANNKAWQDRCFRRYDIPTPESQTSEGKEALLDCAADMLKRHEKLVIKLPELSGGYQMRIVESVSDAEEYYDALPEALPRKFLVSAYVPHSQSFAGMGIVTRSGRVHWCGATEQVLYQDLAYEGLISPPFADQETIKELKRLTVLAGRGLAAAGYYGFFNVDFIYVPLEAKHRVQAVEINARFGFGTLLFACACGEDFWENVDGEKPPPMLPEQRLILGKYKGRMGRTYEGLLPESDILQWYQRESGEFSSFFCGTEAPETYDYGSFIGLFGRFLPLDLPRETALEEFWKRCLAYY